MHQAVFEQCERLIHSLIYCLQNGDSLPFFDACRQSPDGAGPFRHPLGSSLTYGCLPQGKSASTDVWDRPFRVFRDAIAYIGTARSIRPLGRDDLSGQDRSQDRAVHNWCRCASGQGLSELQGSAGLRIRKWSWCSCWVSQDGNVDAARNTSDGMHLTNIEKSAISPDDPKLKMSMEAAKHYRI